MTSDPIAIENEDAAATPVEMASAKQLPARRNKPDLRDMTFSNAWSWLNIRRRAACLGCDVNIHTMLVCHFAGLRSSRDSRVFTAVYIRFTGRLRPACASQ